MFILDDPIFNGLAVSLIFGILVSTVLTLRGDPAAVLLVPAPPTGERPYPWRKGRCRPDRVR